MHSLTWWAAFAILAVVVPASGAVLDVSIEPSSQNAAVGQTVSFDVWLRNIDSEGSTSAAIETLELDFGTLDSNLSFVAGPGVADGFDENDAPIPSELDTTLDGSAVNGHTTGLPDLSYVAFNSAGIAADGPDRMIGTFWVQASATGTYTLSLDHAATSILSSDITEYTKNYSDAQLVVPEPATSALLVLGFGVFLKRRRS